MAESEAERHRAALAEEEARRKKLLDEEAARNRLKATREENQINRNKK